MRGGRWGGKGGIEAGGPWGKRMIAAAKELWETYAAERCEEGSKITQFVLSSCEKRMHDERGTQKKGR